MPHYILLNICLLHTWAKVNEGRFLEERLRDQWVNASIIYRLYHSALSPIRHGSISLSNTVLSNFCICVSLIGEKWHLSTVLSDVVLTNEMKHLLFKGVYCVFLFLHCVTGPFSIVSFSLFLGTFDIINRQNIGWKFNTTELAMHSQTSQVTTQPGKVT